MSEYAYDQTNPLRFQRRCSVYSHPRTPPTIPRQPKRPPTRRAPKPAAAVRPKQPEVQEISREEFLARLVKREETPTATTATTKTTSSSRSSTPFPRAQPPPRPAPRPVPRAVFTAPTRPRGVAPSRGSRRQSLRVVGRAGKYACLKTHVVFWVGLFIAAWVCVMLGGVLWKDEPARLYELRLLFEGMLHDLWQWIWSE